MARIGQLDQRITLQSFSNVADGGGGFTKTWVDLPSAPTVWAHVKASSAREQFTEGRDTASAQVVFTIRNRSDFDEKARIVWGGDNYNIRQINKEGARAMYLEVVAERGVSN